MIKFEKILFKLLFLTALTASGQSEKNADPIFVIQPQFSQAYPFSDGLAEVRIGYFENRKCGYIKKTGEFQIKPTYDACDKFSEELAAVRVGDHKTGKWGYINKQGNFVITPQFVQGDLFRPPVSEFKSGLAAVHIGDNKSGKWGFIDKNGNFTINLQFLFVTDFYDGLALVKIGDDSGKWGYIDTKGKLTTGRLYEEANHFSEGLAGVNLGTKNDPNWVYINTIGEVAIKISSIYSEKYRWGYVHPFKEGIGKVVFIQNSDSRKWARRMIDRKAEILFSDDLFVDDSEFNEGLAKTNIGQYPNRIYGFYDRNGKVIIPPQFDDVSNFKNGFAIFRIGDENTGRLGFIDRTGKIVVNPVFKVEHGILNLTVFEFTEGLAAVKVSSEKGDLWGYIQAPNDNK